jgi:hypothetical protein
MHPNERLLRQAYRAMANGDGRALAQLLTVDTQWICPVAGVWRGTWVPRPRTCVLGHTTRGRSGAIWSWSVVKRLPALVLSSGCVNSRAVNQIPASEEPRTTPVESRSVDLNSGPSGYNGSSNAMARPSICPVTGTTFGSAAERPCVQLAATDRCPVLPLSVVNVMSIVGVDPSNG